MSQIPEAMTFLQTFKCNTHSNFYVRLCSGGYLYYANLNKLLYYIDQEQIHPNVIFSSRATFSYRI